MDGIQGRGHYVGTFMSWQQNNAGWWGEGEIKMFLDNDKQFPTICGTGTEDYFGGAWSFGANYSAPYLGFQNVARHARRRGRPDHPLPIPCPGPGLLQVRTCKATMQALGWRSEFRFLPLQDDIASVAYWYQTLPHAPLARAAGARSARGDVEARVPLALACLLVYDGAVIAATDAASKRPRLGGSPEAQARRCRRYH